MARRVEGTGDAFWRRLMARRKTSGLTVAALCHEVGVSPASFFYWQKRLRKRPTSQDESPVASFQRSTASATPSPMVPVRIIDDRAAEITVEFLGQEPLAPTLRVRFPAGCDERSILAVLQAAARVATNGQRN